MTSPLFLIVVAPFAAYLLWQFLTWDAEADRLRRLSRDLRGARFASGAIEDAERIARAAWTRGA